MVEHLRKKKPIEIKVCLKFSLETSRRTRHVESRYWHAKSCVEAGHITFVKVDGKTQQPADLGTKNQTSEETAHHRSLFEAPYYTP